MRTSDHVSAVLFDRDGTLVEDVPYNGNPDLVAPRPGAGAAMNSLRARGVRIGLVSNQSGVGRGLLTHEQVRRVHEKLAELLGPFDDVRYCPHVSEDGCACRKPAPGMILAACAALGTRPEAVVVVGDIGSDVVAALAAGATPILVPTPATRREEVAAAPLLAPDLASATDLAVELLTGVLA